ncbi:MAG TPA: pseudouridine-5'-phosphate glycosidase [Polyangia bacterium]|jgi:pseudouridine-5'-phosphate glycosidase
MNPALQWLAVAPEVAAAVAAGRPVVALETTLVTHGLPHPRGLATAASLEAQVRAEGAVPATIGVLRGRVRVGMTAPEIEELAAAAGTLKLNPSNLAAQVARGGPGSTTVGATMLVAAHAGIPVFATGGIGGVHREATETGDVSADLYALARHRVAVVCAGAKAVLDLPRTVELLESLGVPIYGLGTDELPAFYRRASGLRLDARFDDLAALAAAVRVHFALGPGSGVVVGNPIPAAHELPAAIYEPALAHALVDAAGQGVRGRAVTPFLLERLRDLTGGASVTANVALLEHNARVAARLARALAGRSQS